MMRFGLTAAFLAAALTSAGCVSVEAPNLSLAATEAPRLPSGLASDAVASQASVAPVATAAAEDACAPDQAFALGAAGARDDGLCAGPGAAAFAAAYERGRGLFLSRFEVEQVKAAITAAQRDLWLIRNKRLAAESTLLAASISVDERRRSRAASAALEAEEARLGASIDALHASLKKAEAEVVARKLVLTGGEGAGNDQSEAALARAAF